MERRELDILATCNHSKSRKVVLVFLVFSSLLLAGCSVFQDDDYIDDKPWTQQEDWENQGMNLPY